MNNILEELLLTEKKLDPVGKSDDDVNNDGSIDDEDEYLANRRKVIAKEIEKDKKDESEELEENVKITKEHFLHWKNQINELLKQSQNWENLHKFGSNKEIDNAIKDLNKKAEIAIKTLNRYL